ncbi:MAG: hypothetical protein KC442_05415, partial [Thermomicrobiales bacterium]|nr:hypothetical protein [Thermomicrobiales bacterium]
KACAEVGRDPKTLVKSSSSRFTFDPADQNPMAVHGTPEEMAAVLHQYANLGMRQHLVTVDPRTSENIERFARVIEAYDRG